MTDDLEMKAVTKQYEIKQAARMYILSGGDILLVNGSREAVIEAFNSLINAVEENIISIERIDESLIRVLNLKQKIKQYYNERKSLIQNPKELSYEISKKAVTLVRDKKHILPLKKGSRISIYYSRSAEFDGS